MRIFSATIVTVMVLLLCLPTLPAASAADTAPSTGQVLITRVCPTYPGEFITLTNFGSAVDLKGWRLSDGEGSVTFNSSLVLTAHANLTWCQSPERFAALYPGESYVDVNTTITKGTLKLADAGDDVTLFGPSGSAADSVYYGSAEPASPWRGTSVPCKKGEMLVRTDEAIDRNSWSSDIPGVYSLSTGTVSVEATPILYPDDGLTSLVREIDRSEASVHLTAYILENWTIARHLSMAEARGVQVTLLLEGQPVGGISNNGAALVYYLDEAGVEVAVMRSSDSFRRYDYLHAKYAVFDERRLLVSSENMADSSFESNRGWAVVVESPELSCYALSIFQRDAAGTGVDIFPLELSVAYQEGSPGRSLSYDSEVRPSVPASASLMSSPDKIGEIMENLFIRAQHRILVQQMRIDEDWLEGNDIMDALLLAAERGVEVKVLLDAGMGTEESNEEVVEALNSLSVSNGWDLEARLTSDQSPFDRMHNKGVIVDDTVLVGSANWVDNSMWQNREMAMMLTSAELTETFSQWFHEDWLGDALPPDIVLPWRYLEVSDGEAVILDATSCSDPSGISDFAWDLDADGLPDVHGPLQAIALPEGEHVLTLTVTDALGNQANTTLTVVVAKGADGIPSALLYLPIPVLGLLLLLGRRGKRVK
ncbi:MAG: phospholipase D-like domain-containing protein [Methanomassiliicoccales archaeon]|nr:phospholipase D-like domain-containing protein [Methanomassiliicoccales archaeon]